MNSISGLVHSFSSSNAVLHKRTHAIPASATMLKVQKTLRKRRPFRNIYCRVMAVIPHSFEAISSRPQAHTKRPQVEQHRPDLLRIVLLP